MFCLSSLFHRTRRNTSPKVSRKVRTINVFGAMTTLRAAASMVASSMFCLACMIFVVMSSTAACVSGGWFAMGPVLKIRVCSVFGKHTVSCERLISKGNRLQMSSLQCEKKNTTHIGGSVCDRILRNLHLWKQRSECILQCRFPTE
uniref:Uncharacterized protein n=1 Tax=Physcomitrium patens TaxID=3218 RepID=A0A2K1IMS1_PHYPA|nr:hypothetical protein PHYPA_026889 [Physcomitrium patens]